MQILTVYLYPKNDIYTILIYTFKRISSLRQYYAPLLCFLMSSQLRTVKSKMILFQVYSS